MSQINHNAVIAITSSDQMISDIQNWISSRPDIEQCRFLLGPTTINREQAIILVPDGSKEGWADSDIGDELRQKFIDRLSLDDYEDGSSPWSWVEIGFGEYGQKVLRGNNYNKFSNAEYLEIKLEQLSIEKLQVGDKVRYQPEHYGHDKWENGIIKEIREGKTDGVWVVYNCAGDWGRYKDYTSALTNLRDLKLGWRS